MTARLPALLATLFVSLSLAAPAIADDAMLVIDASASMGGKLGRDRKIDLVADAISAAMVDFPTESRIGLLAFGAKSKSSCSDAQVLVKPQANGNEAVSTAAAALKPRGKAPIAVALERAANAVDYRKGPATLVMFIDKVEACDADPCVLAASLKKRAKGLKIEVIGLGLPDEDVARVACIAEATGGQFLNARDGTDLAGGLTAALAATKAPPPDLPAASLDAPARITQSEVFEVGYSGPRAKGDRIQISWPGLPPGSEIRGVLAEDGKPKRLTAPSEAGTYEVRYYHAPLNVILAARPIEVAMRPVAATPPGRVQAGAPFAVAWSGPAAPYDEVWITTADGTKILAARVKRDGRPVSFDAPIEPGTYQAVYHSAADDKASPPARFTVDPPSASLSAPAEAAAGSRIEVGWTGPAARFDDVVVARAEMRPAEHLTTARVRPDRQTVTITMPAEAGRYELRYIAGDGRAVFAAVPLTVE